MDAWEGWDFQRFYLLFVGAAFVLLGIQVFLFHWRAAFSRWTMYLPVLAAPVLAQGWWGDDPPFRRPVFVLTHYAREPLELQGGTTFHFVSDGVGSALEQARDAAGGQDVSLAGGADVAQQYLAACLIDEMEIAIVPVLLGGGTRLFENLVAARLQLNQAHAIEAPGVVHVKYNVGA